MNQTVPNTSAHERQLIGLSTLLQLESQVRKSKNPREFAFKAVNDTLKLIRYQQAVLIKKRMGANTRIIAVSGVDKPNRNAPYIIWLQKLFKYILKNKKLDTKRILEITPDQVPTKLQGAWHEWGGPFGLWCPMIAPDNELVGFLWLVRDSGWQDSEKALVMKLCESYAHAWQPLIWRSAWRRAKVKSAGTKLLTLLIICAIAAAMVLPVPLSVLAPAQIVPDNPVYVTAPLKGVIKEIKVRPNQHVGSGQLLFTLDDTELVNRFEVAQKALDVASEEYKRARQKSLIDHENDIDINTLLARVNQKRAELNYIKDELERVMVKAGIPGIALFSSSNDWIGKPVQTGEKIMTLADPAQVRIKIDVPIDNAVNLKPGAKLRLFLNSDPSTPVSGEIKQTAYEAQKSPEGVLSFPVTAMITQGAEHITLGQQGTAKIYGKKVRLYYYLFRRPWAAVRKATGL